MQKSFCFLFILFFSSLFGEESLNQLDQLSQSVELTDGLPSNIVNDSVSVISGEYIDHAVDIVLMGPRPLVFERTYSNFIMEGTFFRSWNNNHSSILLTYDAKYEKKDVDGLRLILPHGSSYFYKKEKSKRASQYELVVPKGLTNGSTSLSGRSNIKNTKIHCHKDKKDITIIGGDGNRKKYSKVKSDYTNIKKYVISSDTNTRNQSITYHEYSIKAKNKLSNLIYSTITLKDDSDFKHYPVKHLRASDGRRILYKFQKHEYEINGGGVVNTPGGPQKNKQKIECHYLKEVYKSFGLTEKYEYKKRDSDKLLQITCKRLPNSRYLKSSYYKRGKNALGGAIGKISLNAHDYRIDRVKRQMAPVGVDDKPVTIYRFQYSAKLHDQTKQPLDGETSVYDAYWHKTSYFYDQHYRLTNIMRNNGTPETGYSLHSTERFFWGDNHCSDNLKAKYLCYNNQVHHGYLFSYDICGNTLTKSLFGKLTGRPSQPIVLNRRDLPFENGYERETITYTYTNDGLNLILSETNSNGKIIGYRYYKGTDLLRTKWIQYNGSIQLREYYFYDENGILTKKISDNGQGIEDHELTGITQRLITYYSPQKKIPYGLHERIEEKYYDFSTGQECLIKRIENSFSKQGYLLKQMTYDANGQMAFVESKEYDKKGNVVKEINPNGEVITKEYDENNNLIVQKGPHPDYSTKNTYDFSNRLIKQEEFHSDGTYFFQSYQYNYLSQIVASIDCFGNRTTYAYNDVGQLVSKQFPAVLNPSNECVYPKIHMEYDIGGNLTRLKNALGYEIVCENNIRGKPLVVTHADGNQEKMFYRLDGELTQKIEQNGSSILYTLDPIGRRIKEEVISSDGQLISSIQRNFNALFLLSEESSNGTLVEYTYDYAGHLTQTHKNKILIQESFYDSMGRVNRIHDYYNENYRVTCKSYDVLNRVTEERIESADGQLLHYQAFSYDSLGNKTVIKIGDQTTHTSYNSYGKPKKIVDALGNTTHISYNFRARDECGQYVLEVTTVDPLGIQTIQRYDALNRLVRTSRKNSLNILLSNQTRVYDICGNCVNVIDDCIYLNQVEKRISTVSQFDSCNRLLKVIEAEGTPQQKCTSYRYNAIGEKIAKVKPDGVELLYEYDGISRLKEFTSSDHTIHYKYEYNTKGQLIKVDDLLQNTSNERVYNSFGQLIKETLDNGLTLEFQADLFNRTTVVVLPDHTKIEYTYDASNLKEVHRVIEDHRIYSQYYPSYNLLGLANEELRPGNVGTQAFGYDQLGRLTSIEANSFSQKVPSDGFNSVGNLLKYETNQKMSYFNYDDLNQLIEEDSNRYSYDSLSNRRTKNNDSHELNALNQLVSDKKSTFTYDANGNLIEQRSQDLITYTYDALDRLIKSTLNGLETTYQYDSLSRRIRKNDTLYFYQNMEEIGSWKDQILELKILNCDNNKSIAIELNNICYIPLQNLFGHVVKLFNLDGSLHFDYDYSAFGEILTESDNNPWLYSNRRYDIETGLFVYNLRYYDPRLGRWISPDPAGFEDGPNLYAHVHNNPLKYYDLMGLMSEDRDFSFTDLTLPTRQLGYSFSTERTSLSFAQDTCRSGFNFQSQVSYGLRSLFMNPDWDFKNYDSCISINTLKNPKTNTNFNYPFCSLHPIFVRMGIGTTKEGFNENLIHVTQLSDHIAYGSFDNTKGLLRDCFDYSMRQFFYYSPKSEKDYMKAIIKLCEEFPGRPLLIVAHSRGCTDTRNILYRLPPELRERIYVLAVAPGSYIERYLCKDVLHLVSKGDLVTNIDRDVRARCGSTIIELDPHPDAFPQSFDHFLTSPTYKDHIHEHIMNFIQTGAL